MVIVQGLRTKGRRVEGSKRAEGWVFNVTDLNHQSWNGCFRLGCMRSRYNIVSIKPSSMLYFCSNLNFLIEVALWLFWPRVWYTRFFVLSFSSVTNQMRCACLKDKPYLYVCGKANAGFQVRNMGESHRSDNWNPKSWMMLERWKSWARIMIMRNAPET